MADLDQNNLKDGVMRVIRMAVSSWSNLARVSLILCVFTALGSRAWLVYSGAATGFIPFEFGDKAKAYGGKANPEAYDATARYIFNATDADTVIFGKADMGYRSSYVVERVYLKDGSRYPLLENYSGIFFEPGNPQQQSLLSAIGAGDVPCGPVNLTTDSPRNLVMSYMQSTGITYRCGVSIPPDPGMLDGGIIIGWKDSNTPKTKKESELKAIAGVAAGMATKRP
jgi:hypothetical protein